MALGDRRLRGVMDDRDRNGRSKDDWGGSWPSEPAGWTPQQSTRPRRSWLWRSPLWLFLPFVVAGLFQLAMLWSGASKGPLGQLARNASEAMSLAGTSTAEPENLQRTVANAAAGTELMTLVCVNFLPDSVLEIGASYLEWAGRGQTLARVKRVGGIRRVNDDGMCLESIGAVAKNPALDAELKHLAESFGNAFSSLVPLVNQAAGYYEAHAYEKDDLARGHALHAPLVAAFDAFDRADRALRSALLERSLAEEPKLLARLQDAGLPRERDRPCKLAVAQLRLASRKLVSEANPPGRDLQRIDRDAYAKRLDDFSAAIDRLPAACADREHSYEHDCRRVLEFAMQLQHRLDSGARYTARERELVARNSFAVSGSPFRLVREAVSATISLNTTQLMRDEKIAEVAPRLREALTGP